MLRSQEEHLTYPIHIIQAKNGKDVKCIRLTNEKKLGPQTALEIFENLIKTDTKTYIM